MIWNVGAQSGEAVFTADSNKLHTKVIKAGTESLGIVVDRFLIKKKKKKSLYNAILRPRADSLRSLVILYE